MRARDFLPLVAAAISVHTSAASYSMAFAWNSRRCILAAHNVERARAGRPSLVWDNTLVAGPAAYARQMPFTGCSRHSNRRARPGTSENLWMGPHGSYPVAAMVGSWVSERRSFHRECPSQRLPDRSIWSVVGHYTQMIWPTTTRVGCAIASTGQTDYLVCRYTNAGNIERLASFTAATARARQAASLGSCRPSRRSRRRRIRPA